MTFVLEEVSLKKAVPWLRRLVAGLSPQRPGFDPGSVHVGFVVEKVALGQVFPRVPQFSPVSIIPPVLLYNAKAENTSSIIFIVGLHNKLQCCGASVASAAVPFNKKKSLKKGDEPVPETYCITFQYVRWRKSKKCASSNFNNVTS
jgi:hypothetical protein